MMDGLHGDWTAAFGPVPPLGHALRVAFAARWVRFHALPGSQRYAVNHEEAGTILARGNALATGLLGAGQGCWLVMVKWGMRGDAVPVLPDMAHQWSVAGPAADFDADLLHVYAKPVIWQPGAFDTVLAAIADDRERALFAQPKRGRVFAPYDGGFDLICQTAADQALLKRDHADWLSARDDML
jgi:hypothetical protein